MKKSLEESGVISSECISSIRTLQSYGLEDKFSDLFKDKQKVPLKVGKNDSLVQGLVEAYFIV